MIDAGRRVDHSLRELVAQRVFSIACGYPDANDSARLSVDPIHKLLLDRDPIVGRDLASQPTLSRFENGVGVKGTLSSGPVPGGECDPAPRQAAAPSRPIASPSIWIRLTIPRTARSSCRFSTDITTTGATFRCWVLSASTTRPNSICAPRCYGLATWEQQVGAVAMLRRLVRMIRHHLPGLQIRVRLDGGFAHPALLQFLDAQPKLEYVVAMAKNAVLKRAVESGMRRAAQALGAQRKDRTCLRGSPPQGREVARVSLRHHQSRGRPRCREGPQRQSPVCHHQHETESAMDFTNGSTASAGT